MSLPFQIKICGVRRPEDAAAAVAAGADAVGLNFYPQSKRYVGHFRRWITAVADAAHGACRVGVFVNATPEDIQHAAAFARLDVIQLHGDETPEFLADVPGKLPILRAIRLSGDGAAAIAEADAFHGTSDRVIGVLLDAAAPAGEYGGTGAIANWEVAHRVKRRIDLPVVLAGGLTPENVADAIAATQPDAVDVASGVEDAEGNKDAELMKRFVAASRRRIA